MGGQVSLGPLLPGVPELEDIEALMLREKEPPRRRVCRVYRNKVLYHIEKNFGCLLSNMTIHPWLKHSDLEAMSELDGPYPGRRHDAGNLRDSQFYEKLEALVNLTLRNVHEDMKGTLKQTSADMVQDLDVGGFAQIKLLLLEALALDKEFVIYGDPAYPLRPLLMKPYGGAALTATQQEFNSSMSAVRQAVEWGFGEII
ncbi:hypothetical protein HPB52_014095 [Rhipicephalus sanguineus]|uniref:DDE Tnp4 domain-containing protein n=1 Tax=Rhipicephalus sanguineus TaxID=34632 RepID=A0A9D4PFK6_RHISA|nr:hypothetical protein HPB52_014095 [Rhipicephalus sanguineus]